MSSRSKRNTCVIFLLHSHIFYTYYLNLLGEIRRRGSWSPSASVSRYITKKERERESFVGVRDFYFGGTSRKEGCIERGKKGNGYNTFSQYSSRVLSGGSEEPAAATKGRSIGLNRGPLSAQCAFAVCGSRLNDDLR